MSSVTGAVEQFGGYVGGGLTGQTAADASSEAAAIQAAQQQKGLDYLMQTEETPQAVRQGAYQGLAGVYGIDPTTGTYTGDFSGQQNLINQAQASPYYQSQIDTGTENVMRNANVTGGLRGGGGVADIAGFESNLLNQAYNQQLQGLQGLAGTPSQAGAISQGYGQIGQTQAQGQIGAAQAQQQGFNNLLNFGGNLGAAFLSDRRLKSEIVKIGTTSHPYIDKYEWQWLPESGKTGKETGYIAQEVEQVFPKLVIEGDDGYKRILKDKLEETLKELH